MFKYRISDLEEANKLCETWATKCVSLLSPEYQEFYKSTPKRLVVFFDDIDRQPKQPTRYVAPKIEQMREVFEFTKSLNDSDRLLVHCKAGIGRSTATMIGVLCQHGFSPDQAFTAVQHIRPQLWPNNLVIEYCDQIFNLKSHLINIIASFKKRQKHKLYIPEEYYTSLIRNHIEIVNKSREDDSA